MLVGSDSATGGRTITTNARRERFRNGRTDDYDECSSGAIHDECSGAITRLDERLALRLAPERVRERAHVSRRGRGERGAQLLDREVRLGPSSRRAAGHSSVRRHAREARSVCDDTASSSPDQMRIPRPSRARARSSQARMAGACRTRRTVDPTRPTPRDARTRQTPRDAARPEGRHRPLLVVAQR